MTRTITLAEGTLDDLPAVIVVMRGAFDSRFGEAWTHAQCAGLLPMAGVWLTLAREGTAHLVGFSLSRIVADEAELLLLAVHPDSQRRGVGRLLLDDFGAVARERGARRLHLEVRDGNGATGLYANAGFTLVGRRPRYYNGGDGQQFDALSLSRPAKIQIDTATVR